MRIKKKDIPKPLLKAFPGYRGRTYRVEIRERVSLSNAYWGGGTRSEYVAVNLSTGEIMSADRAIRNPFRCPSSPQVELPPNVVIVEHAIFCGKDCGLIFHVRPDNVPPALMEGSDQ
jgi:hypothetical protein